MDQVIARTFTTAAVTRPNLAKFIMRQQRENEEMRVNVYATLRKRFFGRRASDQSPMVLRGEAERRGDLSAISLLNTAQELISAYEALLRAHLAVIHDE